MNNKISCNLHPERRGSVDWDHPANQRLLIQFSVRAHASAVGQVPTWGCLRNNRSMFFLHIDVSPPLFLPYSSLSKNK